MPKELRHMLLGLKGLSYLVLMPKGVIPKGLCPFYGHYFEIISAIFTTSILEYSHYLYGRHFEF